MLKIKKSVDYASVPVKKGTERLGYYHAALMKENKGDLMVTDIYSLDLKGYLPKVWVNDPMSEECIERLEKTYKALKIIALKRQESETNNLGS